MKAPASLIRSVTPPTLCDPFVPPPPGHVTIRCATLGESTHGAEPSNGLGLRLPPPLRSRADRRVRLVGGGEGDTRSSLSRAERGAFAGRARSRDRAGCYAHIHGARPVVPHLLGAAPRSTIRRRPPNRRGQTCAGGFLG